MNWLKLLLTLILAVSLSSCSKDDDGGGEQQDDDVLEENPIPPPITEGGWYRPAPLADWQWQLEGELHTDYDVEIYDIDLFDTPAELIADLQADGKRVICYFSAGSYEEWRDDAADFKSTDYGKTMDGWEDERWLDVRSTNVHEIMKKRLDLAVEKGCDGVEPDNMDGYENKTGFDLTADDQIAYNRLIANEAHLRGLAVGLKNDLGQIKRLVDYFDFAVNEQCFEYNECDALAPFIDKGKAVLNAEYKQRYVNDSNARATLCADSLERKFSTLILPLDLDDTFRYSCLQ